MGCSVRLFPCISTILLGTNICDGWLHWSSVAYDSRRLLPSVASMRDPCGPCRAAGACVHGGYPAFELHSVPAYSLLLDRHHGRLDSVAIVGGALMTEARAPRKAKLVGVVAALVLVLAAAGFWIWTLRHAKPSTDDASIDVEVVHIAPLVGGRIIELPIHENELVHKGDLLFRIDPVPYQINVAAAEANLDVARATVGSKRRLVSTQRYDAEIATEQINRAKDNLALSQRTQDRLAPWPPRDMSLNSSSIKPKLPRKMRPPRSRRRRNRAAPPRAQSTGSTPL